MIREDLYRKFSLTQDDIIKGLSLWNSYSTEQKNKFLLDFDADFTFNESSSSVNYKSKIYPSYKKVILCDIAIDGTREEKDKLVRFLSHPSNHSVELIENLFPLIYDWILSAPSAIIFYRLSFGLLYNLGQERAKSFISQNIKSNKVFAKALIEWLQYQPNWFRIRYITEEKELWQQLQNYWPEIANDAYKSREINKALGVPIKLDQTWYHEIENPWHYSTNLIKDLNKSGIEIRLLNEGEIAMGGPILCRILLNNQEYSVMGPFVTDTNNTYLCCKLYSRELGNHSFKLVLMNLKSNKIIDLNYGGFNSIPIKFKDGEIIVLKGGHLREVNFEKDVIKISVPSE